MPSDNSRFSDLLRSGISTLELPEPTATECRKCGTAFLARYRLQDICAECVDRFSELSAEQVRETRAADLQSRYARMGLEGEMLGWTLEAFERSEQPAAYDVARAFVAYWPDKVAAAFVGQVGTGKSHLVVGILLALMEQNEFGLYAHVPTVARRLRVAEDWQAEARRLLEPMFDVGLLVLDDCGREKTSDVWAEHIDALMDHRVTRGMPTILTANFDSLADLQTWLGEAAASRFLSAAKGNVIQMRAGDRRLTRPRRPMVPASLRDATAVCGPCQGAGWVLDAAIPVGRADRLRKCPQCAGAGF